MVKKNAFSTTHYYENVYNKRIFVLIRWKIMFENNEKIVVTTKITHAIMYKITYYLELL